MRKMGSRHVARALAQARLKTAEDRLRERQENRTEEEVAAEQERIVEQAKDMEKVFRVIFGGNGGDIA